MQDDDNNFFEDIYNQVAYLVAAYEALDKPQYGSHTDRRVNIDCGAGKGHRRIFEDYFAENPVYDERLFRRRFRMRQSLFLHLVQAVEAQDSYFEQRPDCTGKLGLSALQKCVAALRQLAYGMPADATDEYI